MIIIILYNMVMDSCLCNKKWEPNQTQKIETSTVTKTLTISTTEITETDIRNQTMSSMV